MSSHDTPDSPVPNLSRLPRLEPDRARAERVRARCHARLTRGRRRSERVARITGFAVRILVPMVVGSVGVLYTAALVGTALRLHYGFY
jgi:hypothetical protein